MTPLNILVLLNLPGVGRKSVKKIIDKNQIDSEITDLKEYIRLVRTVSVKIADKISTEHLEKALNNAKNIISKSSDLGIKILTYVDRKYPKALKDLGNDAPMTLFILGDLSVLNNDLNVAIVGSRNMSAHGEREGSLITEKFVKKGFNVVSGLALGCDTVAHESCLESGGKTIAVLSGGLERIYPRENKELAERIKQSGCLISEYPIGTKPQKIHFIERNRIQVALSKGIVVIESEKDGGTMRTVEYADKLKRKVACINFEDDIILPVDEGNRMLISEGRAFALNLRNLDSFVEKIS